MRVVVTAALLVASCGRNRDGDGAEALPTWDDPVAGIVAARCGDCHGGDAPAGGYDLGSYLGALGGGSDAVANAIAGDPSSRLLTALGDDTHRGVAGVRPLLTTWVVDARLAYRESAIHAPGLLNPAAPDFHGRLLRDRDWDFALCQRCHGDDFAGGASGASCLDCHRDGPTACSTCHRDGPTSGAHAAHRQSPGLDRAVDCGECHRVPRRWDAPGHIVGGDGRADPPPAEVELGPLAARDLSPPRRSAPPVYDPATGTCRNVYCHGGVLGDPAAAHAAPVWTGGAGQAACGGCHGAPPASHASAACARCHPGAAAHLDGALDVGDGSGPCSGCHGDASSPAPPRALDGATLPSALAVGAHRSHLEAPSRLRPPIACDECHVVPAEVDAPGHIDSDLPAEVFPAGAGVLARAGGASPAWDRDAGVCRNVYCHGDGAPRWTAVGRGEAACGRCHGLPPADGRHDPELGIADCTTCHSSVDDHGNILFTGDPGHEASLHLDGHVDLR